MATIGQRLTSPEEGWRRYDGNVLSFPESVLTASNSNYYSGTMHYQPVSNATVLKFKFKGTKLRVIADMHRDRHSDSIIKVDSVTYPYLQNSTHSTTTTANTQLIVFEIDGLTDGIHEVELVAGQDKLNTSLDAIDIDEGGRFMHPDEVMDAKDLEIGKRIRCHYVADTNNTVGYFSRLGEETADFIPVGSGSRVEGDFYFICVDRNREGRLIAIADRNIQHSISWDVLNSKGIASGSGVPAEALWYESAIPPMSSLHEEGVGTILYSSSYGNSTTLAIRAFDDTANEWLPLANRWNGGYLGFDFESPEVIQRYTVRVASSNVSTDSPRAWHFEASNDGQTWTILDSRTGQTGWSAWQSRHFEVDNDDPYKMYRIRFTQNTGGAYIRIDRIRMYKKAELDKEASVRLLTGGISAADRDNEWDKYIVDADLGGVITPGDRNEWNWGGVTSWTSTTLSTNATHRVRRGNTAVGSFASAATNTTTSASTGFRPVFEVDYMSPPAFVGNLDKEHVHGENVTLTGVINDEEGQPVQYNIHVNGIQVYPTEGYTELTPSPVNVEYAINNNLLSLGNNFITIRVRNEETEATYSFSVSKESKAPTIEAVMTGMKLEFKVTDEEDDQVQYRVELNGRQVFPQEGGFTELEDAPVSYDRLFNSSEAPVGEINTVTVIVRDSFGAESRVEIEFEGKYSELMFSDEMGNFYSTDLGDILQYLDVGVLVAGQISETYPVRLINMTGYAVSNITLTKDRRTLPNGTNLEISKTESPFISEPSLVYSETLEYNKEITFYVRLVTSLSGNPGHGEFDVHVTGDPD